MALGMDAEARRRVIEKFLSLTEEQQQKLCDAMGDSLAKLKADWEAQPENKGKTITYTELWRKHTEHPSRNPDDKG